MLKTRNEYWRSGRYRANLFVVEAIKMESIIYAELEMVKKCIPFQEEKCTDLRCGISFEYISFLNNIRNINLIQIR